MTQLQVLSHAKDYLDQLDNYTDPISGASLPPFSAGCEEEIHKFFYFSSKNLDAIIAYDNIEDRPCFSATPELISSLTPADGARRIKQVADIINQAVDLTQYRGMSLAALLNWLTQQGYLRENDGHPHYLPTDQGQTLGIRTVSTRFGASVVFDPPAQQFIFDHLADIVQSMPPARKGQRKRAPIERPEYLEKNLQAMELLSQGRHPLTQAPLDPRDPLGQERLRKCFAFVAQALKRSMEVGYYTAKAPFTLPRDLWDQIPDDRNIALAELLRKINGLLPDPTAVEPLSRDAACGLLVRHGLLAETPTPTGRKTYVPTPQGNLLGIVKERRTHPDGDTFMTTVYSPEAQRFLAEHMEELISPAQ